MKIRCFLGKGCFLSDVLAGFQKDYKKYNAEEGINDPHLSITSISESQHIRLDGGKQGSDFLRSYYFHKALSKEINVSLAVMKLKKNKKLSILKSAQVCEGFVKNFYVSRAFVVWKYGPDYDDAALWPKSARKFSKPDLFGIPYSSVLTGILGTWFNFNQEEVSTSQEDFVPLEFVNPDSEAFIEPAPEPEPETEPIKVIKKKKVLKKKKTALETVPEDSGDEEAASKTQQKKTLKKKNDSAPASVTLPKPMTKKVIKKNIDV
jgi:hypothetical protein